MVTKWSVYQKWRTEHLETPRLVRSPWFPLTFFDYKGGLFQFPSYSTGFLKFLKAKKKLSPFHYLTSLHLAMSIKDRVNPYWFTEACSYSIILIPLWGRESMGLLFTLYWKMLVVHSGAYFKAQPHKSR